MRVNASERASTLQKHANSKKALSPLRPYISLANDTYNDLRSAMRANKGMEETEE